MGLRKSKYIVDANLSDVQLDLLVKSTRFDREALRDFYASFIKDCPNGYLTKKDFLRIFKQLHPNQLQYNKFEPYCNYVFE
jgi:Ca2+-binding EF-hand superfamily protein